MKHPDVRLIPTLFAALAVMTVLPTLASDGVTFDFGRLSAEKFRGELSTPDLAAKATWTANKPPHAVQERKDGIWSTTVATNAPDRQVSSWWATVPVGPNPDGLRVRVSFSYRSHRAPGRLGNTYCIPNDQRGPETYETFTLATTDDKWHSFARDFNVAPGVETFRLHQRLDGPGDFEFKDLSIRPIVADATKPPVTVTAMPYGWLGREFAVPSNQCAIVAYSWARADPKPEAAARDYVFTYELDPGFEPVEPLFGDRDSVRIVRRADGGTVVSVVSDRKPPRDPSFGNWDRFGFVVATSAPVGTRGKARLSCTCRGEPCSNVEELELFVVPEIRAKRTDGYRIGVSDSGIGWMRPRTERGRKAVARLMADSGVGYVLTSDSAQIPYLREAGIGQVIHNGIRARNGFEIGIGRPIPADERFVALNPKSRAGMSDAVCPASVYLEKPFFVTNTLETFRRQLKGFDGAQINWEPYYYAGQGCMCDTCCREFAKWANLDYADVKRDWPACVVRKTGRFGGRIREFRCWQHGRLMGTLNRYVTAFTGGETSTGFIPEVECGMATSNRRDVRLFDETDVESYVRDLRWINFWGPYSGIWDMRSPYVHRPEEWVLDFHYARNVGRAMKTDHPDLRIEGGFIITGSWMIEPEILELNLKAQFFNRWDASVVFQYPSGLDARHWAALANAASCAAEYGDFVRNGRRIDGTVVLTPSAGFPKPVRAANRHVPEYDNVSLLQHVAYERNGRRLVAVFNYRADGPADFTLCFADRGDERRFTVPAARCAVLEFGGK